jgi:undecaprenyl-phosphate 4-deoxy-4-formamido-L-arabinose transferase
VKRISLVFPVYNEENVLPVLYDRVYRLIEQLAYDVEVILINDGSQDNSHEICHGLSDKFRPQVTYLNLAKNFGEHNAVMAGLNYAQGDYVVIMDDDFQNPPLELSSWLTSYRQAIRYCLFVF